jgi:hypothetical protein
MIEDELLSGVTDSIKPWTIKSIASASRDKAIVAARGRGQTVGQWLEWAIDLAAAADTPVGQVSDKSNWHPQARRVAQAVDLVATLASAGVPLPADVTGPLFSAIRREFKIRTPPRKALPPPEAA